jgi:hypothetical protein
MKRSPRALTSQMDRVIETALAPGRFVSYNLNFSFVAELEAVEHELARLIPSRPAEVVALYETFLAGCYEKAEEIDDSSGSFGQFVDELYCGWIKARQAGEEEQVLRRRTLELRASPVLLREGGAYRGVAARRREGAFRAPSQDGLHGRVRRDRRGLRSEQDAVVPAAREGTVGHATMRDGSKAASLGQPARGE